jgi:hypothetical protein
MRVSVLLEKALLDCCFPWIAEEGFWMRASREVLGPTPSTAKRWTYSEGRAQYLRRRANS